MKKLIALLLAAVLLVSLCACSDSGTDKEKDDGKKETVTIVGTWEYSAMSAAYVFNEDGTGAYRFGETEMPFTYEDDGTTLKILYENSTSPNEFKYTIKGNTLSIEDSFGSITEYTK